MILDDKNQDLTEEQNKEDLLKKENQKKDNKVEEEDLEEWLEGKSIIELSFKLFKKKKQREENSFNRIFNVC